MDENGNLVSRISDEDTELRRGPWTLEEDFTLINYIAQHGDGRWNSLARCAGLKRTGKSCRLRWLNYLRPEVRRGNITLEEQLLILELHSQWGNRWSKIAQHLPGRTDNEIKNYWRTRVQKHAKQLKCDVNSKQFKDTMRYLWMPRLVERIQAAAAKGRAASFAATTSSCNSSVHQTTNIDDIGSADYNTVNMMAPPAPSMAGGGFHIYTPETSSAAASSDSFVTQVSPEPTEFYYNYPVNDQDSYLANQLSYCEQTFDGYFNQGLDFNGADQSSQWIDGGDVSDNLWIVDDMFLQQQLNINV